MLMLSPTAIQAVRAIITVEGSPEGTGLRITTTEGAEPLQMSVAAAPAEHDQVLAAEGARIFMDQDAAIVLDDKILDTEFDIQGDGTFILLSQGGSASE